MAFDNIFDHIGGMGAYQISLFAVLSLPSFYGGLQSMAMIFIGPYQNHWCKIDSLLSLPYEQQKRVGIPYNDEDEDYEHCTCYDVEYGNYTTEELCAWNTTCNYGDTRSCDAWVYDQTEYAKTAVSEYNLVCNRAILVPLVYSFQVLSAFIAVIVAGTFSDYFGRKKVMITGICCQLLFGIMAAVSPNYGTFLFSRTFLAFMLTLSSGYVITTEIVGPQYRVVVGTVYWMFWSVGFMVLPCIAVYVTDFRYLQLILALLTVPGLSYIWLAPESPRWLAVNNRIDEAEEILQFIAEVNTKEYPEKAAVIISEEENKEEDIQDSIVKAHGKYSVFVKNPTIRKTFLLIVPAYIASGVVYYGLSFNIGALGGNIYINTFLSGLVEIPANLLALLSMYVIGRRKTQFLSLTLAGLFCLFCIPFLSSNSTAVTSLSMTGKAFITISFTTVYLYTTELFPTVIRGIAFGLTEVAASFGGMLAPFMGIPLMSVWEPLPLLIFGLLGVLSGPLMLVLPETNDQNLPDTIEQAEAMWRKTGNSSVEPIAIGSLSNHLNTF